MSTPNQVDRQTYKHICSYMNKVIYFKMSMYKNIQAYKHTQMSRHRLSKITSTNTLIAISKGKLNTNMHPNNIIYRSNAVRHSLRTHQKFVAATHYNTRIGRSTTKINPFEHTPTLIDSSTEYQKQGKTPAAQYQIAEYLKKQGQNLEANSISIQCSLALIADSPKF